MNRGNYLKEELLMKKTIAVVATLASQRHAPMTAFAADHSTAGVPDL